MDKEFGRGKGEGGVKKSEGGRRRAEGGIKKAPLLDAGQCYPAFHPPPSDFRLHEFRMASTTLHVATVVATSCTRTM